MIDEESLEAELKSLNIKEDDYEGDSDITPTNSLTPPTPPTVLYVPHPSNTSGFYEAEFARQSEEYGDTDMRSNSSLSWGEDEFEGEATRIVNGLFHQIDEIVYTDSSNTSASFPLVSVWNEKGNFKNGANSHAKSKKFEFSLENYATDNKSKRKDKISTSESFENPEPKSEDFVTPPSTSLLDECNEWTRSFPHLRVCGIGINVNRYEKILSELTKHVSKESREVDIEDSCSEEVILKEGTYNEQSGLLFNQDPPNNTGKKPKGPPSRVCSGSEDPAILKEHILIKMFDYLWPVTSKVLEPLLCRYAEAVIQESLALTSLSRESSCRGNKDQLPSISSSRVPLQLYSIPIDNPNTRPLSRLRASSAFDRSSLGDRSRRKKDVFVAYDQLDLSRSVTPQSTVMVPRTSVEPRINMPQLPPISRPLSSKAGRGFLKPIPTSARRPLTTSSFSRLSVGSNSRLDSPSTVRGRERPSTMTVDDLRPRQRSTDDHGNDHRGRNWSRHNSILPRIKDAKSSGTRNIVWNISETNES